MTTAILNVSSLLLGLTAWALCVRAVRRERMSLGSFFCCLLAMVLQFAELYHRAEIGDISAILDTVWGILLAASTLAAGTLILNTLAHLSGRK